MIIQSISSGRLDDRADTGAACPDTVTHPGGGKKDSLTKQQATAAGLPSTQTLRASTHGGGSLAGCTCPCPINTSLTEKAFVKMFEQAKVK